MALPNNDPIYTRVAAIGLNAGATLGTAVVSDYNGTGANNAVFFTADATNGGFIRSIRFKALGTNAVSVARIYINNGSTNTTAANNSFFGELALPATTASTSGSTPDMDYVMNFPLPPGYRIVVGISAAANLASGWAVTVLAGAY